jgi:hypothetical protein
MWHRREFINQRLGLDRSFAPMLRLNLQSALRLMALFHFVICLSPLLAAGSFSSAPPGYIRLTAFRPTGISLAFRQYSSAVWSCTAINIAQGHGCNLPRGCTAITIAQGHGCSRAQALVPRTEARQCGGML